jgi:hypothetical protein
LVYVPVRNHHCATITAEIPSLPEDSFLHEHCLYPYQWTRADPEVPSQN